jgi:hypothetical protein
MLTSLSYSLPTHGLISTNAGEIWYAVSILDALMFEGLAVLFFLLAVLPYWFKLKLVDFSLHP